MKKIFLRLFLLLTFTAQAQMHDAIWNIPGWTDTHIQNGDTSYTIRSTYLDFRKSSPPLDSIGSNIFYGSTFYANYFCDSLGSPRIFTNGNWVHHAKGPMFANGDSLQPSIERDGPFGVGAYYVNVVPGYFIVLPTPGTNGEYHMFALDEEVTDARIGKKSLLYTHLKGVDSDSTGYIAKKNVELIHRKYLLPIEAIKHANGRDWWILAMEDDSIPTKIELNTFLLTPNGIEFVQKQFVNGFEPTNLGTEYWHLRATPNGQKIVMNNARDFFVMDFDRCSGLVTQIKFQVHEYFLVQAPQFAISPNSRFLYVPAIDKVLQYDLNSNDIEASKKIVLNFSPTRILGVVGYFLQDSTITWPEEFVACNLAFDGKIYLTGNGFTYSTYFSSPNDKDQCRPMRQGAKTTCGLGAGVQHPNFRLGPIDGTNCDSLGLDNKPIADFWWSIDPDSSGNKNFVVFQDNSSYEPSTWRWWFKDGTGQTSNDTNAVHIFPALGTYEVCLEVCNQNACDTICKLVQLGMTVAASDIEITEDKVLVYPNPITNGFVTIAYNLVHQPLDLTVWNENGILVGSQRLSQEREDKIVVNCSVLPSGIYYYRIRDLEGGIISGKFLVNK
jgi:PKD repeat protein